MKQDFNQHITHQAIAFSLKTKKEQIIALLKKYGVVVSSGDNDEKIIIALLVSLKRNKNFKEDLKKLLEQNTQKELSFTAESNSQFFNVISGLGSITSNMMITPKMEQEIVKGVKKTSATSSKTALGSYLKDNLGNILNKGLDTISTVLTNKSNQQLVNKAKELEELKMQTASIQAASAGMGANAGGTAKKMSTGAKIAIGAGALLLIGTLVFVIVKKRAKK